jgi:hypothetical protein
MSGCVQQFSDKPVVTERDSTAGTMRDFTIRTSNQSLVRVTVFPEGPDISTLGAGDGVFVDGSYSERTSNGTTYKNLTARTVAIVPAASRTATGSRAATKTASF